MQKFGPKSGRRYALTFCQACRKQGYSSRKLARRAAKDRHPGDSSVAPYQCHERDDLWHVGHLPKAVVRGEQDRSMIYQKRYV